MQSTSTRKILGDTGSRRRDRFERVVSERGGGMNQATSPDQRRFRRYGIKLPCRVKPRASGKSPVLPELAVETLDVSGGGLFFLASAQKWTIGTTIEFELDLPADVGRRAVGIQCRGKITRVVPQEGGRIGIGATIEHYKISALRKASRRTTAKNVRLMG